MNIHQRLVSTKAPDFTDVELDGLLGPILDRLSDRSPRSVDTLTVWLLRTTHRHKLSPRLLLHHEAELVNSFIRITEFSESASLPLSNASTSFCGKLMAYFATVADTEEAAASIITHVAGQHPEKQLFLLWETIFRNHSRSAAICDSLETNFEGLALQALGNAQTAPAASRALSAYWDRKYSPNALDSWRTVLLPALRNPTISVRVVQYLIPVLFRRSPSQLAPWVESLELGESSEDLLLLVQLAAAGQTMAPSSLPVSVERLQTLVSHVDRKLRLAAYSVLLKALRLSPHKHALLWDVVLAPVPLALALDDCPTPQTRTSAAGALRNLLAASKALEKAASKSAEVSKSQDSVVGGGSAHLEKKAIDTNEQTSQSMFMRLARELFERYSPSALYGQQALASDLVAEVAVEPWCQRSLYDSFNRRICLMCCSDFEDVLKTAYEILLAQKSRSNTFFQNPSTSQKISRVLREENAHNETGEARIIALMVLREKPTFNRASDYPKRAKVEKEVNGDTFIQTRELSLMEESPNYESFAYYRRAVESLFPNGKMTPCLCESLGLIVAALLARELEVLQPFHESIFTTIVESALDLLRDFKRFTAEDNSQWRIIREVLKLVCVILDTDEACGVISLKYTEELATTSSNALLRVSHRGSFAALYSLYKRTCIALGPEWCRRLLDTSIEQLETHVQLISRRSAAMPFTVLAPVVATHTNSAFVSHAFEKLINMAKTPCHDMILSSTDLPQVHAFNCLRHMFGDSELRNANAIHIGSAFVVTVTNLDHALWPIRNSALMLFGVLHQRIFGTARMSATLLNMTYPEIAPVVVQALQNETLSLASCLVLLQSVFDAKERFVDIAEIVRRGYLANRNWGLRERAARSLLALWGSENCKEYILLCDIKHLDRNAKHGILLLAKEVQMKVPEIDGLIQISASSYDWPILKALISVVEASGSNFQCSENLKALIASDFEDANGIRLLALAAAAKLALKSASLDVDFLLGSPSRAVRSIAYSHLLSFPESLLKTWELPNLTKVGRHELSEILEAAAALAHHNADSISTEMVPEELIYEKWAPDAMGNLLVVLGSQGSDVYDSAVKESESCSFSKIKLIRIFDQLLRRKSRWLEVLVRLLVLLHDEDNEVRREAANLLGSESYAEIAENFFESNPDSIEQLLLAYELVSVRHNLPDSEQHLINESQLHDKILSEIEKRGAPDMSILKNHFIKRDFDFFYETTRHFEEPSQLLRAHGWWEGAKDKLRQLERLGLEIPSDKIPFCI